MYKTTRSNAYLAPGANTKLANGLDNLVTEQCGSGISGQLNGPGDFGADLYQRIQIYAMGGLGITNTDQVPAPPCRQQSPQKSIGGPPKESTLYPHVHPQR
jgi:hypothetical protein